jgi:hypothetical protein
MQDTDREQFKNINLMSYYGGMPVAQLNGLMGAQDRIRKNDAPEAAKHTSLQSSISAVKDLTTLAAASAESPFYKMDHTSPFLPEQQKWNEFVSKYGQALDDWRQNNTGKIPTDMQKREIAQGILFPNGISGQSSPVQPTPWKPGQTLPIMPADYPENLDPFGFWVAQHLQANGRVVSDETISAAKKAMIAQNPNVVREYPQTNIVPVQKAGE